jgi:AraC-like DNA-binding protein
LHDVAFHALALLAAAEQAGVPRNELLANTGIHPAILDPPYGVVAYAHVGRLIEAAVARTGDPCIGLKMALLAPNTRMGVFHYDLRALDTAEQGLRASYELLAELSNIFRVLIETDGDVTRVQYTPARPDLPGLAQMEQFHMAIFTLNFRKWVDSDYRPRAIHARHSPPPDTRPYAALFRCPVRFGAPENVVELDSRVLAYPLRMADPELRKAIAPLLAELRAGLPGSDALVHALRNGIALHLGEGRLTLRHTAARMGIAARTLQHRLRQVGTTFQQLVDEVRAGRATTLLASGNYSVSDIAFRLGYGSTAAFHRAFRRWTGQTPWEYRETHPPSAPTGAERTA